jgi:two-component sensor histidine kinase
MIVAVRARVSGEGVLLSADAELLRLQEACGGSLGGPLLLPAPARLAKLAHRLQTPIERPVLIGDDHTEIRAHGRFFPEGDGVRIELVDWDVVAAPPLSGAVPLAPLPRRIIPPGVIHWACDVRLRLVMVEADPAWGLADRAWLGRSMSELFHLTPDNDGKFALLEALAGQAGFTGQSARMAMGTAEGTILGLKAQAMIDDDAPDGSGFTGFVGDAVPVGFGQLPADVAVPHGEDGADVPESLLGALDMRSFAMRIDGAMRRPLGRIIANAETISGQLQGPIRADYARYASDIALAGRHLLDLVDDLADLQAVERENFTIAEERVDLADVARRAAGLLAMKAQERGMRIDAPHSDESAVGTGEFRRVLQILLNLIGNAIRYGPDNGLIWLRVDGDDSAVSITVADQGPGIAAEDQARLFEKFERLGRTDAQGSGLGLYISRRLARAMGGDITLDSAPGQGARFTLTLPVRG